MDGDQAWKKTFWYYGCNLVALWEQSSIFDSSRVFTVQTNEWISIHVSLSALSIRQGHPDKPGLVSKYNSEEIFECDEHCGRVAAHQHHCS